MKVNQCNFYFNNWTFVFSPSGLSTKINDRIYPIWDIRIRDHKKGISTIMQHACFTPSAAVCRWIKKYNYV